jgi:hypothetical protein
MKRFQTLPVHFKPRAFKMIGEGFDCIIGGTLRALVLVSIIPFCTALAQVD